MASANDQSGLTAKRLGQIIHGERLKQGYATADEFAEAIENATGLQVPKDSIQRAEAGRQWPKLTHYIGMAITLGLLYDPLLVRALPPRMLAYRATMNRRGGIAGKGLTMDGREIIYTEPDEWGDGAIEVEPKPDEAIPWDGQIAVEPRYPFDL